MKVLHLQLYKTKDDAAPPSVVNGSILEQYIRYYISKDQITRLASMTKSEQTCSKGLVDWECPHVISVFRSIWWWQCHITSPYLSWSGACREMQTFSLKVNCQHRMNFLDSFNSKLELSIMDILCRCQSKESQVNGWTFLLFTLLSNSQSGTGCSEKDFMDFDICSDRTEKEMSIKASDVKTFFLVTSGSV